MVEYTRLVLPIAIGAAIGASGALMKLARNRGRGQLLYPVGRPPRSLFEDRRISFFVNLIHAWAWIDYSVMFIGFMVLFAEGEIGLYLIGVGIMMMLVHRFGTPLCLFYAKLARLSAWPRLRPGPPEGDAWLA